jgi:2-oxo-3-hexenedioate decarboxylase
LRHLVDLLVDDARNARLRDGEIVSTGTLSLARPVNAGQIRMTKVHGIPLENISSRIEA